MMRIAKSGSRHALPAREHESQGNHSPVCPIFFWAD